MTDVDYAVIAADLHLKKYIWTQYKDIEDDAFYSLKQCVDIANRHGLPLVLLGDIFDKARPDAYTLNKFIEIVRECRKECIYIQGNHDLSSPPWPSFAGIKHLHRRLYAFSDATAMNALDYHLPHDLQAAIDNIPANAEILIMHQAWQEIQKVGRTDGTIASIYGTRLLLTGDYHVRLTDTVRTPTGEITFHSPGSTCMQSVAEDPNKYVSILSRSQFGQLYLKSVPLVTRPKFDIRILTEEELETQIKQLQLADFSDIPANIRKAVLRIRYAESIPNVYERLVTGLSSKYCLFLSPYYAQSVVEVTAPVSAMTSLKNAVESLEIDPVKKAIAIKLLDAPDPTALLDRFEQLFIESYSQKENLADALQEIMA